MGNNLVKQACLQKEISIKSLSEETWGASVLESTRGTGDKCLERGGSSTPLSLALCIYAFDYSFISFIINR
jgi:hypothetical protein